LRHTSATGIPASPSFRIATIWLSLNLLFLIGLAPSSGRILQIHVSTARGSLRPDYGTKINSIKSISLINYLVCFLDRA
jgi:hypothetical protein